MPLTVYNAPSTELAYHLLNKHPDIYGTVEAEYGDTEVKPTRPDGISLAHHGSRSANPAPCVAEGITPNTDATVIISHLDADTLGGLLAIAGTRPDDPEFWNGVAKIDVEGRHHMFELPSDVQDKLNALNYQISQVPRFPRDSVLDVSGEVAKLALAAKIICDERHPLHDQAIAEGREWATQQEALTENCLVAENENVRIFISDGPFCSANYYSPNENSIAAATLTYNTKTKTITLAYENGGDAEHNAAKEMQELFGDGAGGRAGIGGSPRGQEMTMDDFYSTIEKVAGSEMRAFVQERYDPCEEL